MHQSIPTAPSPLPGYCGAFSCPPCQSRGLGICKFCAVRGPSICQPRGQPRAFDTHAVSCQNTTAQRILLKKKADWLICQGSETIEEVCKGMFCISSLLASQNYMAKSGAIDVNQRLLNQISVEYYLKNILSYF